MRDALLTALIAAGAGLLAALVTSLLGPRLQYIFNLRTRQAELRMEVIRDFNRLTAEYLTHHLNSPGIAPGQAWFSAFSATEASIKALFSCGAYKCFKNLEVLVGPNPGGGFGAFGKFTTQDFVDRKHETLRKLYREV